MKKFYIRSLINRYNLFLTLLSFSVFVSAQQAIGRFTMMNGGFEGMYSIPAGNLNTVSWTLNNTANIAAAINQGTGARTGNRFLSVTQTGSSVHLIRTPQTSEYLFPETYTIQYYYKNKTPGTTATMNAELVHGPDIQSQNIQNATAAQWTRNVFTATPNSNRYNQLSAEIKLTGTCSYDFDDFVIYPGNVDNAAPTAPLSARAVLQQNSVVVSWSAPTSGTDGGGYVVVKANVDPTAVPNPNGIYAVGNVVNNGTGSSGTVVYVGTDTRFTDTNINPSANTYYRIYAVDKAFNYSPSVAVSIVAAKRVFTTVTSGSWSNASVWSTRSVPTENDEVIISPTNNVTVTDNTINSSNITVSAGASLIISKGSVFWFKGNAVNNGRVINYGTLENATRLTNNGTISNEDGSNYRTAGTNYLTGNGSFVLTSSAKMYITTATGLDANTGPVRCQSRNFSSDADYNFDGVSAQVTGTDFPNQVKNVTINNHTQVTLSKSLSVNGNLIFASGTLNTSLYNLFLSGNVTGNGTLDASNGTIGITGSVEQLFAVSTSPNSSFSINPGSKLTNTGSINASTFMIMSDNRGTGTFINKGTFNAYYCSVQQYLDMGRNWYVSSPMSNAMAPQQNINTYYEYIENGRAETSSVSGSTAYWKAYTPGFMMTPGKGYIARSTAATYVSFTGKLNTSDVSVAVSRTPGVAKEGFNLIGNPFVSYINWDDLSLTNVKTSIWQRSSNGHAYVFDTYNATAKIAVDLSGKGTDGDIAPMQAFWVRVDNNQTGGNVVFKASACKHRGNKTITGGIATDPLFKARAVSESTTTPILRLQVTNGVNTDETVLYQNENASNGNDNYDSPKMSNDNAAIPEVYTTIGNEQMVINGLNAFQTGMEIPLGFKTGESNSFRFKASKVAGFDGNMQIILRDKETGAEQELTEGSEYNFSSDATSSTDRFSLVFRSASATTGVKTRDIKNTANVYTDASNRIVVDFASDKPAGSVEVFSTSGERIAVGSLTGEKTILDMYAEAGVYMVKVNNGQKTELHKVILK